MSTHFHLTTQTTLPLEVMFARSLSIDDHVASMSGSQERAIAGVTTGRIGLGESVTWRARHFGMPFRMTSTITALEEPHRFIDEQVKGPFKDFRHEHVFSTADGVTTMSDHVTFTAPLGPLGRIAEQLVLGRYLKRLIAERNTFLSRPL